MDNREFIIEALGAARLEPYLQETGGHKKQALHLYRWSVRLAASVQEALGLTEVLLRNAVDRELQAWNSDNQSGATSWLLQPPASPLRGLAKDKIKAARKRAEVSRAQRSAGHPRVGTALSHDDVLAHIMFSFWRHVLPNHAPNANPDDQGNRNRLLLWEQAISQAFPYTEDIDGKLTYWRVSHLVDYATVSPIWIAFSMWMSKTSCQMPLTSRRA